ncbi:MAG: hypothetical protein RMK18_05695 [Armatimonadota bacterium]|nr:hypothetical protein [Armatimonadota bacterium]MCX7777769.1 hypothetical protein [Armatimonadota bacterium]MDW8025344.1 hypothetical protein [Armatimonadota bacterium]
MPKFRLSKEQRAALKAVKQVQTIVEEVKGFQGDKRHRASLQRRIKRLSNIVTSVFLPQPLQEALERAYEALVACKLVVEDYKAIADDKRQELLLGAELMAKSAAKLVENHSCR